MADSVKSIFGPSRDSSESIQSVAEYFNRRSDSYESGDAGEFHRKLALELVNGAQIQSGQTVLDVATGTGLCALAAATLVGPSGRVVGVDISPLMLAKARQNARAAAIENVEFIEGAAETVSLPGNTFDHVLCSAALVFMPDPAMVLNRWRQCLKPGGSVAFDTRAYDSSDPASAVTAAAMKYGIQLPYMRLSTIESCTELLTRVGFEILSTRARPFGARVLRVEEALNAMWTHPLSHPILRLSDDDLAQVKRDFTRRLRDSATLEEIHDETIMNLVFGRKPLPIFPGTKENRMTQSTQEQNKALVLRAFDLLFNKRDYAEAEKLWSPHYIQHSAHIEPGRQGLFNLVRSLPADLRYECGLIVAEGDFVIAHGRFSGFGGTANWIAADILLVKDGVLVEHWDVIQDEATEEQSKSKAPMFGDRFPT